MVDELQVAARDGHHFSRLRHSAVNTGYGRFGVARAHKGADGVGAAGIPGDEQHSLAARVNSRYHRGSAVGSRGFRRKHYLRAVELVGVFHIDHRVAYASLGIGVPVGVHGLGVVNALKLNTVLLFKVVLVVRAVGSLALPHAEQLAGVYRLGLGQGEAGSLGQHGRIKILAARGKHKPRSEHER